MSLSTKILYQLRVKVYTVYVGTYMVCTIYNYKYIYKYDII